MAGPAIEFNEYRNYINLSMFDDLYCKNKIPKSTGPALWTLLISLLFFPLMVSSGFFPVRFLITQEFFNLPILEQLLRVWIHPTLGRMKFYFGWYMAEGACILAGVGYNGVDKNNKPIWNRCSNMDVFKVEFPPNIRSVTTYWNMKTGDWLKNYVYLRLTPAGQKPTLAATIGTYAISAFWHGFYPGYYLFFLVSAIYTEYAKDARRVFRPYFQGSDVMRRLYDFLTMAVTIWFMNYAGASFFLLSWEFSLKFYNHFMWIPHFMAIGAFVILRFVFVEKKQKKKEN